MDKQIITIPIEEYKELLIIKGKYEELKSQTQILHLEWFDNNKRNNGLNILPCKETRTTDPVPVINPPYKITCEGGK